MPRAIGHREVKVADLETSKRCQTCDGIVGRDAFARIQGSSARPTDRSCPDCAGRTRQCSGCHEYLAMSWFGGPSSTVCTLCVDLRRRTSPWKPDEVKRLYDASQRVLHFWPQYFDRWSEDDLVAWRELLAAIERPRAGSGDAG